MSANRPSALPALGAKLSAVALAGGLVLTGCSGADAAPVETTLTKAQQGAVTTITYTSEGKLLTQQKTENVLDYAANGIADRAAAEEQLAGISEQYKNIDGVQHSIEFGDEELVETVTIRFAQLDVDELARVTGADPGENPEDARKVKLTEAVQTMKDQGFTEAK